MASTASFHFREFAALLAHPRPAMYGFGRRGVFYSAANSPGGTLMYLGSPTLTFLHVAISLIGILSGIVVGLGLLAGKRMDGLTSFFLWTTILTSVTGFVFFPFHGVTPGIIVGILSLIVLVFAWVARYTKKMEGGWRKAYVVTAMIALYFNVFVLIVQSFQKVPALHALAPTQNEAPFKIVQLCCLLIFVIWTILATMRFRSESSAAA
jgi:hypothetical protein